LLGCYLSDSVTEDRKTFSAKWKYNALNYLYIVGIVYGYVSMVQIWVLMFKNG